MRITEDVYVSRRFKITIQRKHGIRSVKNTGGHSLARCVCLCGRGRAGAPSKGNERESERSVEAGGERPAGTRQPVHSFARGWSHPSICTSKIEDHYY